MDTFPSAHQRQERFNWTAEPESARYDFNKRKQFYLLIKTFCFGAGLSPAYEGQIPVAVNLLFLASQSSSSTVMHFCLEAKSYF